LKKNGVEHYHYVVLYIDGILAIVEEPETFLREELGKEVTLKENEMGSGFTTTKTEENLNKDLTRIM